MKGCRKKTHQTSFNIEKIWKVCFKESRIHKEKSHNNNKTRRRRRKRGRRNVAKKPTELFLMLK
jgi:hypothetical protein